MYMKFLALFQQRTIQHLRSTVSPRRRGDLGNGHRFEDNRDDATNIGRGRDQRQSLAKQSELFG